MRLELRLCLSLGLLAALVAEEPSVGLTFLVDRFDDAPGATNCSPFMANDCSLRGAVLHANNSAAADEILLPNGTYQLTVPGVMEDLAATGDLDVLADLTVRSAVGAKPTIVQTAADRIFHIKSPSTTVIFEGPMTLQGGFANGGTTEGGGSIYVTDSNSLTMTKVTLAGGSAEGTGGCLHYTNGLAGDLLFLQDVTVTGCASGLKGGGISVVSTGVSVVFDRVVVEDCQAVQRGGGLFLGLVTGPAVVQDSILRGNTVGSASVHGRGGGLAGLSAQARLVGTSVVGNRAELEGSAFAGIGAGIELEGGWLELRNSTISGNRAGGFSLAPVADVFKATLDLYQTTVTDNLSDNSDNRGIHLANSSLVVEASILEGGCFEVSASTMTSQGYNVERPTDGSMVSECNLTDPTDILTSSTVVRPLAGNGGPTPTHALAPISPAHLLVPTGTCAAEDQRHAPRPGIFCDAGSYESGGLAPGQWIFADGYESGDSFAWSDETP
jgi:hypothetical protein